MTWLPLFPALLAAQTVWAGHQVIWGTAHVPLLGERATRVDNFVLALVDETATQVRGVEHTCQSRMAPVAGVRTALLSQAYGRLPPVAFGLTRAPDGMWRGSWEANWTSLDHDGDGAPGVSVQVSVPLCSGRVYVTTQSLTHATGSYVGAEFQGETEVTFTQQMVGASNVCLRLGAAEVHDMQRGVFRYVPVPQGTTCASLSMDAWPALGD